MTPRQREAERRTSDPGQGRRTRLSPERTTCASCPARMACLSGALSRREPYGVWGGELLVQGTIVPRKRPRGRPTKAAAAAYAAELAAVSSVPTVEQEVDRCIECGYCESVCPSRHITTTPRQRIVIRREMLRQPTGSIVTEALLKQYE